MKNCVELGADLLPASVQASSRRKKACTEMRKKAGRV